MEGYVKIEDVKIGTKLIADGGFTCIPKGAELVVSADADGELQVPCNDEGGWHALSGQLEKGVYIGFRLAL